MRLGAGERTIVGEIGRFDNIRRQAVVGVIFKKLRIVTELYVWF
jgi:hypothetical protein